MDENEILSEFRDMPVGARSNVEEHGPCFSRLDLTRGLGRGFDLVTASGMMGRCSPI